MARLIISDVHADIRALDAIMEIVGDPALHTPQGLCPHLLIIPSNEKCAAAKTPAKIEF